MSPTRRYYWRVRLCDHLAQWIDWSETAWFETAFLDQTEWLGSWIAPSDLAGGKRGPVPLLRREFEVSETVVAARIHVAARGIGELIAGNGEVDDATGDGLQGSVTCENSGRGSTRYRVAAGSYRFRWADQP